MRDRLRISPQLYATVSLVALGALALIVLTGAGVRLTGSGLGCPDWPKCYGGTTPPLETHAVIEYGNRLLTGFVGFAVIAASVLAWFRVPFRWHLAFFGALLPLGVIGQAILGALVVKYHLAPGLVMSHFILSMLLLDASFALAWCSRYEPWERRRSSDRLGVWAVRALIPLGQLTIAAGTVATASGPHAGAHAGQLVHRFDFEGTGTLEWVVQRHSAIATVFGLAAIAVWFLLRRPGGDRRALRPLTRDDRPPGPTGRRRRRPVGSEAAGRDRLGPRRPGDDHLAGDALDGRDGGAAGAALARGRFRRLCARVSTTTWVIGRSIRSRALSTTPCSSQRERSGGWVEITISSAGKTRRASSIATLGSESPISPFALRPSCLISISESSMRWRASSIASSMSEAQCEAREEASAGVTTITSQRRSRQRSRISFSSASP